MTVTPFTFVKDVIQDKQYIFDETTSNQYIAFVVNRALSLRSNLLPYAEIANSLAHLPLQMQHDFLFFAIPKQANRFSKWPKKKPDEELMETAQLVWNVGPVKAKEIMNLLDEQQLQELTQIKQSLESNT